MTRIQTPHSEPHGALGDSRPALAHGGLKTVAERALDDGQADDVVVIDLAGKSSIADHMIIATGRSQRQVAALAERLRQELHKAGAKRVAIEGLPHGDWVLIDAGDLIVHLFRPEVRSFYNLEKMWGASLPDAAYAGPMPRPLSAEPLLRA